MLLLSRLFALGLNALPETALWRRDFSWGSMSSPWQGSAATSPSRGASNPAPQHQGSYPNSGWTGARGQGSPPYPWIFDFPLPIPNIAKPLMVENVNGQNIEYYQSTIEPFVQQVYPDRGPAHLVGYGGVAPGDTYFIQRGTETIVRYLNNGTGPSSVHLHGSNTHSTWDGWASDLIAPGQYKDYFYPNSESARPMWYHDHVNGKTASDAYYGQSGCYILWDPAENALALPAGKYDVPLTINDKMYQQNGDLVSPDGATDNFFGDIIHVNEQPWPYFAVEPRKYRLRLFDMSLSRPYQLWFADQHFNPIEFDVIASDSGLFGAPVKSSQVTISMGERYEVIFDFSSYQGQNITMMNGLHLSVVAEFPNTDKVMRFTVGNTVSDSSNNGPVPSVLNPAILWPPHKTEVDQTFKFQQGGEALWTINGVDFNDVNNRVLARPVQGQTELWEVVHAGGNAVHPVHIHLVNLQILSRTGGSRTLMPYETAGLKDVVLLEPGETIRLLAVYGPWNGMYMFHCHNLVHEDNTMLDVFNVTRLEALGYQFNNTYGFFDPMDPRFAPQPYSDAAYQPAAIRSVISSLASLDPYGQGAALSTAEQAYWATAAPAAATTATAASSATPSSAAQNGNKPSSSHQQHRARETQAAVLES